MRLLLVPLDDSVLFPNMTATVAADVGDEKRVLVLPRSDDGEFAEVGTVAEVLETARVPGAGNVATLAGLHRGVPESAAAPDTDGRLRVEVRDVEDSTPAGERTRELEREFRAVVEEILQLRGDDGRVSAFVRSITDPGTLADTSGYSPDLSRSDKVRLLETTNVTERLELAVELQRERLAELQVRRRIRDDVEDGAQKQQRECASRWSRSARSWATTTAT